MHAKVAAVRAMARDVYRAQALFHVINLGVVDAIVKGKRTADELCTELGLKDAEFLMHILRALSSADDEWFVENADGSFSANENSHILAGPMRNSILHLWETPSWLSLSAIDKRLKNGPEKSPFELVHGMHVFDYYAKHPESAVPFDNTMTFFTESTAPKLAEYEWSRFKHIIDIGGSKGILLRAIHEKHPNVKLTLFDLPNVVPEAAKDDPFEVVSGDFFRPETIPRGGDCYVMKYILHDWSDAKSELILRNIASVMDSNATIVLLESIVPPFGDTAGVKEKWMAVWMGAVTAGGKERTLEEWKKLFGNAGLKLKGTEDLAVNQAIEAVKA